MMAVVRRPCPPHLEALAGTQQSSELPPPLVRDAWAWLVLLEILRRHHWCVLRKCQKRSQLWTAILQFVQQGLHADLCQLFFLSWQALECPHQGHAEELILIHERFLARITRARCWRRQFLRHALHIIDKGRLEFVPPWSPPCQDLSCPVCRPQVYTLKAWRERQRLSPPQPQASWMQQKVQEPNWQKLRRMTTETTSSPALNPARSLQPHHLCHHLCFRNRMLFQWGAVRQCAKKQLVQMGGSPPLVRRSCCVF